MAKNLLRSVMATSFRRSEITAGNVTKQPVPAHEAITSSSGGSAADDPRQPCQGQAVADRGDQAPPACSAQRPPAPPPHGPPLAPAHLDRAHPGSSGHLQPSATGLITARKRPAPATMPANQTRQRVDR